MRLTADLTQPIVDRAMTILQRNINIMDDTGVIVASGDPSRIGAFHEGAARVLRTGRPQEIHPEDQERFAGSRPGVNLPIRQEGQIAGVVGITGPPAEVRAFGELLREMVQLVLEQARDAEMERMAALARESVLRELLMGTEPLTEGLIRQAHVLDLQPGIAYQVMITPAGAISPDGFRRVAREAGAEPVMVTGPGEGRLVLVAGRPPARLAEALLQALPQGSVLAVGLVGTGLTGLRESYRSAMLALKAGMRIRRGGLLRADELHLETLLAALPPGEGRRFAEAILGGLHPASTVPGALARQTIEAYLGNGMSRTRAAQSLGIHRHTMISRLDQVTAATGLDPREPSGAMRLALAMLLEQLFGHDVGIDPVHTP